jgi:monoamine oxidase
VDHPDAGGARSGAVDVAIVGAGLAGLTAAHRLTQAGVRVVVLEAKDRVGGRTRNADTDINGTTLEVGGRYFGPGQDELIQLADELGIGHFDVPAGKSIYYRRGERLVYDERDPVPIGDAGLAAYDEAFRQLDRLAATVDLDEAWNTPDAVELDRTSFGSWLDQNVPDPDARFLVDAQTNIAFAVSAYRLSLLQVLYQTASCGGSAGNLEGEKWRFVGGSAEISRRIAAQLGDAVRVGVPVRAIDTSDPHKVVVRTDRFEVDARECIVAMSPADARFIAFEPPLPPRREMFHRHYQAGAIVPVQLVYDTPFWLSDGLNGRVVSDLGAAPFTFDSSPADGSLGVMLTFLFRIPADSPLGVPPEIDDDPELRRDAVTKAFAEYFGAQALSPIAYVEKDWQREPFTQGVSPGLQPGLMTEVGPAFSAPVGRLHWSSTESATRWQSWMAGAVNAGNRATREVLHALGH